MKFTWPEPQSFIAIALVAAVIALMFVLAFNSGPSNVDVFKIVVGTLVGAVMTIVGYYFGSSKSSRAKDDTISTLAGNAPPPAPAPAASASTGASVTDVAKGAAVLALMVFAGALAVMPAKAMAQTPRAMDVPLPKAKAVRIAASTSGPAIVVAANAASSRSAAPSSSVPANSAPLSATQVQQNPLLLIKNFTIGDLQAALADANAQTPPDTGAAACYATLLTVVQSNVASPLPAGPGLFQALQKARDAKALIANLQSPTGPLSALNTACAPLVLDAQSTLLGLGVGVGLVASPVAPAAGIVGVPAAVAAFIAALPK
jgi:hypothetical protein